MDGNKTALEKNIFQHAKCRFVCVISLIIALYACAPLTATNRELLPSDPNLFGQCGQPFMQEPWRLVHKIEAVLSMGKRTTMMGVTRIDPAQKTMQGILMTIEGLVLFDGLWQNGEVTVFRAVPPFDRPAFAENMMNDMSLLFLVPHIASLTHAMQEGEDVICRYYRSDKTPIDVIIHGDQSWSARVFGKSQPREITAAAIHLPAAMELKGQSYTLKLTAITAEPDAGETTMAAEPDIFMPAMTMKMTMNNPTKNLGLQGSGTATVDWRGDGAEKETKELSGVTSFVREFSGINSLTITVSGANIITLDCVWAGITELDVSRNTALTTLSLKVNQLTSLDLSKNTALTYINIKANQFTAAALDDLFHTLHGSGGTINIAYNPGTDDCNKSIAEKKGWTVEITETEDCYQK